MKEAAKKKTTRKKKSVTKKATKVAKTSKKKATKSTTTKPTASRTATAKSPAAVSKRAPKKSVADKAKKNTAEELSQDGASSNEPRLLFDESEESSVDSDQAKEQAVDFAKGNSETPETSEDSATEDQIAKAPTKQKSTLTIDLSASLNSKLLQLAEEEGIGKEELIHELLSEGAVLRAWQVIERRSPGRDAGNLWNGHQQGNGRSGGKQGNQRGRGNQNHNSKKGRRFGGNNNVMDDSASFLEYVRNQEKRRRN